MRHLIDPLPEPSPDRVNEGMLDTRTGQPVEGPPTDTAKIRHVDRIAAGFDRLDRAETLARHKKAFGEGKWAYPSP